MGIASDQDPGRRPEFPSGSAVSGLAKRQPCALPAGMASVPPKCPTSRATATSSQPTYERSQRLSPSTAQAPPPLTLRQEDIVLVMMRQRRGHMSSHTTKRVRRGGLNLCCQTYVLLPQRSEEHTSELQSHLNL